MNQNTTNQTTTTIITPIDALAERVHAAHKARNPIDRYHPLQGFRAVALDDQAQSGEMLGAPGLPGTLLVPLADDSTAPVYGIGSHAFGQVAGRYGFPAPYLRSLPAVHREALLNYHLHQAKDRYTKPLMFRSRRLQDNQDITIPGGREVRFLRAMMTDRYQPFDDTDLIDMVVESFQEMGLRNEVEVVLDDRAEDVSHMRFTFGDEMGNGDRTFRRGISISNSEVGMRSVSIRSFTWVRICTNGLMGTRDAMSIIHTGKVESLSSKVRDAIEIAATDTAALSAKFADSQRVSLPNPVKTLEDLTKTLALTQDQFKRSLEAWGQAGAEPTKWGIVNALTRAAQGEETTEGRYQVELAAGRYLDMAA